VTGATLILAPLRPPTERWEGVFEAVTDAIAALDVAVAQGVSACPPYVAGGVRSAMPMAADHLLVFACPADIGIFEAAPLLDYTEDEALRADVARFFRSASEAALALTPDIAWIVAHDWSPNARVRWAQGSVDDLVRFATSPGAWFTHFIHFADPRGPFVQGDDAWPFCFAVGRSTG
jgi:hypothetical protein